MTLCNFACHTIQLKSDVAFLRGSHKSSVKGDLATPRAVAFKDTDQICPCGFARLLPKCFWTSWEAVSSAEPWPQRAFPNRELKRTFKGRVFSIQLRCEVCTLQYLLIEIINERWWTRRSESEDKTTFPWSSQCQWLNFIHWTIYRLRSKPFDMHDWKTNQTKNNRDNIIDYR